MNPMEQHIYLDYAATTPVDERVLDVMLPYFKHNFGNSSSIHYYGQRAETALEEARLRVAECLGCQPGEVIFTSCGSESDNLALRGIALAQKHRTGANHLLISPVEHHAVTRTAQQLASLFGFELEYLPVDEFGRVSPLVVANRLRSTTAVVSVIHANNEIGTINPIAEIGLACREAGVPFHTDSVQAAGYLPVRVNDLNVDSLSLGAHKFYGPKGVGVLYVRSGTPVLPILTGGGQEAGRRAGTHNIPYIAGLAEALYLSQTERDIRTNHVQPLRNHIIASVLEEIPGAMLTGHPEERLPNHASFVFEGVDGNSLLMMLDVEGYACSSGSACKTGDPEPSDVLLALNLKPELSLGSLRVTLGMGNSSEHVRAFVADLPLMVERVRKLN